MHDGRRIGLRVGPWINGECAECERDIWGRWRGGKKEEKRGRLGMANIEVGCSNFGTVQLSPSFPKASTSALTWFSSHVTNQGVPCTPTAYE